MIVKDKFILLRGIPNVLNIPDSVIKSLSVEDDVKNMVRSLHINERQINHFTKNIILKEFSDWKDAENKVHIVNIPKYPIPISYNLPTKKIVINLNVFNADEISRLDGKTIFGSLAYGLAFQRLVTGKSKIKDETFGIITSFLTTVLIRSFGKEYGLLGVYSNKIPRMKFLLSCYVLGSFFGITGTKAYKRSYVLSPFNYQDELRELNSYDFTNIEDFIKSLTYFKIMPGISKYNFTSKLLRFLGINFLPAFEDASRFVCSLLVSNIGGANIIPSFIFTYNQSEFSKIIEITKRVMK